MWDLLAKGDSDILTFYECQLRLPTHFVVAFPHPLSTPLAASTNWTLVDDFSQLGGEVETQAQEMDSGEFVPSAKKKTSSCNKTPQTCSLLHCVCVYVCVCTVSTCLCMCVCIPILTNKIYQWLFNENS